MAPPVTVAAVASVPCSGGIAAERREDDCSGAGGLREIGSLSELFRRNC